jgi:signal transduction histidine kinase
LHPLIETIRSTAFKLAIRYVVFFALSTIAIFAITYHAAGRHLLELFHTAIAADVRELTAMSGREDLTGLAEEIQERVSQGGGNDDYYLLLAGDGRVIAGNLAPAEAFLGWKEWERPIRGSSSENDHLIGLGIKLESGATLVAAQSVVAMRETQGVILETFVWGTLISIVLALAGGYAQSKGPVQRLRAIAQTTRDIVDGRFDRRIVTTGSLDDLDRISLDINRMLDRIQDLMQSLKQVSSDIAHDLRTPISRLRQELETLQRNPGTLIDTQTAVDSVLREVDLIIDTFDALLRIAQIEGGARRANFQTVDISSVLENVTGVYASVAEDRGHLFEVEIEGDCILRGDRDLLTQLFANLIENTLTHVPAPSSISVTLKRSGNECRCVVADEGPGIPEQEHDKVFRRLYRLERSRTTPGSGLGLSMVSAIAELHGAAIKLDDNRPGLIVTVIFHSVEWPSLVARPSNAIAQHAAHAPIG